MKNTILSLTILLVVLAPNLGFSKNTVQRDQIGGVVVEQPIAQNPLVFRVSSFEQYISEDGYVFKLMDKTTVVRYHIEAIRAPGKSFTLYYNSQATLISKNHIATDDVIKLIETLRRVNSNCPADLTISRQTFQLLKIAFTCDTLSMGELKDNAG